jgi:tetratricopeptide (TPR) repeat protein
MKDAHPEEGQLLAYAMGHLDPDQVVSIKRHLVDCADCAQAAVALETVGRAAATSHKEPTSFASARMKRQIENNMSKRGARVARLSWQPAQVALGVMLAMGSGAVLAMASVNVWPNVFRPSSESVAGLAQIDTVQGPREKRLQDSVPVNFATSPVHPEQKVATAASPFSNRALPAADSGLNREGRVTDLSLESGSQASPGKPIVLRNAASWPDSLKTRSKTRGERKPKARSSRAAAGTKIKPTGGDKKTAQVGSGQSAVPAYQEKDAEKTASKVAGENLNLAQGADALRLQALRDNDSNANWINVGDAYALAGDAEMALDAFVRGLRTVRGYIATARLFRLVSENIASEAEVMKRVADDPSIRDSAEGMRLLCSWKLRINPGLDAVNTCAEFAQKHPKHPAMRIHVLAAGRVAESQIGDCELAIKQYTKAILVSQYAGISSTEAIFSRARCLAKMGREQEARADLQMYLHIEKTAVWRREVAELMQTLGVTVNEGE